MFKKSRIRNLLKNDLYSLFIPEKEKVLPEQALLPKRKENGRQIFRIRPLKAALACLLLIVLCTSLYLPLKYSAPPVVDDTSIDSNIPSINSTGTTSSGVAEEPKFVISADVYDGSLNKDEGIPNSSEIYISDMLKTKMEEYKGQDVLFRVLVDLPATQEETQNFLENILFESDEYTKFANRIRELEAELETYSEYIEIAAEYHRIATEIKEETMEPNQEFEELKKEYERIKPFSDRAREIYEEIHRIKRICLFRYYDVLKSEKLEFAKNLGAVIAEPEYTDSEIKLSYFGNTDAIVMNLSEGIITEMAARGGFAFKLAAPDRAEGYDGKISDSLTVLLDQASTDDKYHVAVVTVLDKTNGFASYRFAQYNPKYNTSLNKGLQGVLTNERVKEFIDDILARNSISEMRIKNSNLPDFCIANDGETNVFIGYAGFEADLTKEQILTLTEDPDVKVIYPMNVSGADDYVNGDA